MATPHGPGPTKAGNPVATKAGIEQRERIVEMVTKNIEDGGDGLTRAQMATAFGIAKPTLLRHLRMLLEDGRIEQIGMKVVPSDTGHIHICRTCGQTMHDEKKEKVVKRR